MYPAFKVGLFKYQQVGTNMTPEASVETVQLVVARLISKRTCAPLCDAMKNTAKM